MKLLLDTHIWAWALLEPARLSRRVTKELNDPENELWLSPISIWELLLLQKKGRLDLGGDPLLWLDRALPAVPVVEAPLTFEVAREAGRISLSYRDPADHFLAATAIVFALTLVTADRHLAASKAVSILTN